MRQICAAILAGGRARRFGGADKASLVVGGARIIERQLAALATVTDDVRIVSNDPARYAALGVRVIPDRIADAGPLGGVHAALVDAAHHRHARPGVIVLACDLPFVTTAFLEALAIEFGTGEEIDAVVPRSSRGFEPLCALYAARCAETVRRRIEAGNLEMRGLLTELRFKELRPEGVASFDDGSVFLNINTPHDYERARAKLN
ncbi:MAG TPA: molybdenum cofactor guanylyltransferase [Vicinamibacterales bacterium]|nr:molybdenum cofactor guanylyltransferase [Vicinamibacterales bacterium]